MKVFASQSHLHSVWLYRGKLKRKLFSLGVFEWKGRKMKEKKIMLFYFYALVKHKEG